MKKRTWIWKLAPLVGGLLFLSDIALAEGRITPDSLLGNAKDTIPFSHRIIHRLGVEIRPGYIFPTNPFLKGNNYKSKHVSNTFSGHLRYSFQFRPDTYTGQLYKGVYQGIGVGYYHFGNKEEIGNPIAFYLFQGANIAQFNTRLSLNYEWNFGISAGWKPSDMYKNPYNKVIGSEANAYLNANLFLKWMLSRPFDMVLGVAGTHFSNGNTKFPNAGLNAIEAKIGLVYNFNRRDKELLKPSFLLPVPVFPRHVSYDLTLFGSWRRRGVFIGEGQVPAPDAYTVLGFNFTPMYNVSYRFRTGVSLDGVYDESANVYMGSVDGADGEFYKSSFKKQIALGLSGRVEYVMPYFSVGMGVGTNVLHGGGDLKGCYQVLTLKIELTRSSFLHVGYNLKDFHEPNYLMLGIGIRLNNQRPTSYR